MARASGRPRRRAAEPARRLRRRRARPPHPAARPPRPPPLGAPAERGIEPLLAAVFDVIDARSHEPISLRDVAAAVGLTTGHLTTVVGRRTGRTVQQWFTERRMREARRLLADTDLAVGEIAHRVGYREVGYFVRRFRAAHGVSPRPGGAPVGRLNQVAANRHAGRHGGRPAHRRRCLRPARPPAARARSGASHQHPDRAAGVEAGRRPTAMLTVHENGGVVGALLRTAGHPALVSAVPPQCAGAVVEALVARDPEVEVGPGAAEEAEVVGVAWSDRTGAGVTVGCACGSSRSTNSTPARRVAGAARAVARTTRAGWTCSPVARGVRPPRSAAPGGPRTPPATTWCEPSDGRG